MNSHRDYFLKHLGIGEMWQLRQAESNSMASTTASDVPHSLDAAQVLSGFAESKQEGRDIWERLFADTQTCNACTLCSDYGKRSMAKPNFSPDLVLLFDWSEQTNYDPILASQVERLVDNILLAAKDLSIEMAAAPLLNSNIPSESTQIPVGSSAAGCGLLLERYLKLTKPKRVLVCGARIALALGLPAKSQEQKTVLQWDDIEIELSSSIYDIMRDASLKRVLWQQMCRIASEIKRGE